MAYQTKGRRGSKNIEDRRSDIGKFLDKLSAKKRENEKGKRTRDKLRVRGQLKRGGKRQSLVDLK